MVTPRLDKLDVDVTQADFNFFSEDDSTAFKLLTKEEDLRVDLYTCSREVNKSDIYNIKTTNVTLLLLQSFMEYMLSIYNRGGI